MSTSNVPHGHLRRWVIVVSVTIVVLMLAGLARASMAEVFDPKLTYQPVDSYTADGRMLRVTYTYGSCDSPAKADVIDQTDQRVVVAVTAWSAVGVCDAMAHFGQADVLLDAPLDGRPVYYDTGGGDRLVRRAPTPVRAAGMRGVALKDVPCPWRLRTSGAAQGSTPAGAASIVAPWDAGPIRPVTGRITAFWICQWHARPPAGMGKPTIVTPDYVAYHDLVTALQLPNKPPTAYCTLQGVIQPLVIARTTTGDWAVKLPSDGCGRPLRAVQRAIAHGMQQGMTR